MGVRDGLPAAKVNVVTTLPIASHLFYDNLVMDRRI